jgi:uncharacterized protein
MKLPHLFLFLLPILALRAADGLPIFNATLTTGKEHRFVLLNAAGKASSFLSLGQAFEGYTLKGYDPKSGVLQLERDGKVSDVTIAADAAVKNAPAAATRGTVEDATAVLTAMNFEQMMDRTMEGVKRQQRAAMEKMTGQMAGNADRADVAEFQKKMMDEMMSGISGADMKADVAKLYSEIFSKDELQALASFYASPLGQSFSEKQPIVAEKMNEIMMPRIMAKMPKVQQMGKEFAAAQKAKREAAGGGAPGPAQTPAPAPAPKQ